MLQALADSASIAMEAVSVISNLEARLDERTEALERSRAELEVANRELESFSVSVAHDLRSPLIAIEGFRQIMLESCAHTYDEENREYLARIGSAVTRMQRVIEDLLCLSKVSLQPLERSAIDLSAMARELADGFEEQSADREIEFVIPEGLVAVGDRGLVRIGGRKPAFERVQIHFATPCGAHRGRRMRDCQWRYRSLRAGQRGGLRFALRGQALQALQPSAYAGGISGARNWAGDSAANRAAARRQVVGGSPGRPRRDFLLHYPNAGRATPRVKAQSSIRLRESAAKACAGHIVELVRGAIENRIGSTVSAADRRPDAFAHVPAWQGPRHLL